jgi:hypothetical protein
MEDRRSARVGRLERLVTPVEASPPLTGPAASVGRELASLDALGDPADAERRRLLARRLDQLLPYPLRPDAQAQTNS